MNSYWTTNFCLFVYADYENTNNSCFSVLRPNVAHNHFGHPDVYTRSIPREGRGISVSWSAWILFRWYPRIWLVKAFLYFLFFLFFCTITHSILQNDFIWASIPQCVAVNFICDCSQVLFINHLERISCTRCCIKFHVQKSAQATVDGIIKKHKWKMFILLIINFNVF